MDFAELEKLLRRIDRFRIKLQIKDGEGEKWSYTFENGEKHFYSIAGVKSAEEVEDEIETMFIWLWNLKDYVKKYALNRGKGKQWIEVKVNADPYLCVCADIANSLKHGGLDPKFTPRSNKNPKLGKLKYHVPQEALGSISFGASDVGLEIENSSLVKLEMPVFDQKNKIIGDAFKYLDYSLKAWENFVKEVGDAV